MNKHNEDSSLAEILLRAEAILDEIESEFGDVIAEFGSDDWVEEFDSDYTDTNTKKLNASN